MGVYIYWTQEERQAWSSVKDPELNEVLQEVRQRFNNEYYVREYHCETKKLFRKPKKHIRYEILVSQITQADARLVNFAQSHDWSINTMVDKSYVLTYFFGLLTGINYAEYISKKAT